MMPWEIMGEPTPTSGSALAHGFGLGSGVRPCLTGAADVAASQGEGSIGEFGFVRRRETYHRVDPYEQRVLHHPSAVSGR